MASRTLRSLRFARAWFRGPAPLVEEVLPGGALLLRPDAARPLPAWVVLHGMTRTGRRHPGLLRFAGALASTGAAVLVPEIPAWRDLRLVSAPLVPVLEECLEIVDRTAACRGPAILVGFSFGCPQLLVAAGRPGLRERIGGVLGYGGYADPGRVVRFLFTGRHGWDGEVERLVPDPYGRWVIGANFLTRVPGHGAAAPVADALRELAFEAGSRRVPGDHPSLERYRAGLDEGLPGTHRPLFRLFAPPRGARPDPEAGETMAAALRDVLEGVEGASDPRPHLARLAAPVRLVHGRSDRLIPWSETRRLASAFPPGADARARITGLFAHSRGSGAAGLLEGAVEGIGFLRTLRDALALDRGRRFQQV